MNFKYIPELSWRWGYYAVLGSMFVIGSLMLAILWKKVGLNKASTSLWQRLCDQHAFPNKSVCGTTFLNILSGVLGNYHMNTAQILFPFYYGKTTGHLMTMQIFYSKACYHAVFVLSKCFPFQTVYITYLNPILYLFVHLFDRYFL